MAEPPARLQHERREEGDLPRAQEDGELRKSKAVKTGSLARLVTGASRGGQVPLASRPSPGASPRPTGPRALISGHRRPPVPGSWPARPAPRPPRHPEAGLPGAKWRWGGPAASPGGRGKCYFCLLLSSGTGCLGRGGPEAAAAARPRPPGIFERCSWVPGGWQTWQRRVGRTPKPTTGEGGGRVGGRRQQERLATQRPARGGRREPGRAQAPALPVDRRRGPGRHVAGGLPGRAAPGIEATLFPRCARPRGGQRPAPQGRGPPPHWSRPAARAHSSQHLRRPYHSG